MQPYSLQVVLNTIAIVTMTIHCFFVLDLKRTMMCVFICYRVLDLSFNRIRELEKLEAQTKLKKLFLVQNKIAKIQNIGHMTELEMLELGANRIRVRVTNSNEDSTPVI